MGNTPRDNRWQVPMTTRSSDVSTMKDCAGRWALQLFYEGEELPSTYFGLGSAIHETIERTIIEDLDCDQALVDVAQRIQRWQEQAIKAPKILDSSSRTFEGMHSDANRMIHNWFRFAHPDSKKRHPVYSSYQWPPTTEVPFFTGATWGSVDTVYYPKKDKDPHLIVDWKSGARVPGSDFQLNFYRAGLDMTGARAGYHMLDRVRLSSVFVEAAPYVDGLGISRSVARTQQMKQALLDHKMPEFTPGWQCDYCNVRPFCPEKGDDKRKNKKRLRAHLKLAQPVTIMSGAPVPE